MKNPELVIALFLVLASQAASSAEQRIVCPTELPAASLGLKSPVAGWTAFISSPLYLHDAAPIAGPPERLGTLIGEMTKETKTEWAETYSLDAPYPEGKWFKCAYGENNAFSLSQRLSDGTKECTVKGKLGSKMGQHIFDIVCR
jgi:hypothetical protein